MPGIPNLDPLQRAILEQQNLLKRVNVLEQQTPQLPMLNADPPASSGINMWILTDGRVRIRLPNGTIKELAGTTPGSGTSGSPVPTPTTHTPHTATFYPVWSMCYKQNGATQRGSTKLYYGFEPTPQFFYGMNMSIIVFPSTIPTLLSAAKINWIHFYGTGFNNENNNGSTVHIGGGSYGGTPPASYISSFENKAQGFVPIKGAFRITLPSFFWSPFATGTINGITLNAPNNSGSNFGGILGSSNNGNFNTVCRLVINYTL